MSKAKSKTLSLRLTALENETIKSRAEESGVSVSRYIVNAAMADEGLSLTVKQQVYEHKTIIKDVAKQLSVKYDDPQLDKFIQEVDTLWKLLK